MVIMMPFCVDCECKEGIMMTMSVCTTTEPVHMKKHICAQRCGLPYLGSICKARMRAAMKRIANIGAKLTVYLARISVPSSFVMKGERPMSSTVVLHSATRRYTTKNTVVRMIVLSTAGATGGVLPSQISFGPSIMKMPTMTVEKPP